MDKFKSNLHTHTTFSDGADTAEEMVLTALNLGFESLGFSEHSPVSYENDFAMLPENVEAYLAEIKRLKAKYAEQIEIYLGIETDALLLFDKTGLDFTIGSVHDIMDETTGKIYTIDYLPEEFDAAVNEVCGGDIKQLVKLYYKMLIDMLDVYKPDIIGHLDIITKLNGSGRFFDEKSPWYRQIEEDVAQKLKASGFIAEVNTGGMARGYRKEPYPSEYFLSVMCELGVPVTISSDAHSKEYLDFHIDESLRLIKKIGYKSVMQIKKGVFTEIEI